MNISCGGLLPSTWIPIGRICVRIRSLVQRWMCIGYLSSGYALHMCHWLYDNSFGIILYEIVSRKAPFPKDACDSFSEWIENVRCGLRPDVACIAERDKELPHENGGFSSHLIEVIFLFVSLCTTIVLNCGYETRLCDDAGMRILLTARHSLCYTNCYTQSQAMS